MEDMLDKMIEESEKLKDSSGNLTLASLRDHGEKVGDPISRKRAKHNQIKRKQTMVEQALKKRKQKENNLQTQASMNNVYVPMMTSPATQASVNNVYVSVMNEANSSMNKYVEILSQASTTDQLVNVAFTGNYNKYFGFATDVDAVIYLMLVNDMIHGLYPEAVSIDEYCSMTAIKASSCSSRSGLLPLLLPAPPPPNPFSCLATAAATEIWLEVAVVPIFFLYLQRPPPYRAPASASSVSMDSRSSLYSFFRYHLFDFGGGVGIGKSRFTYERVGKEEK
ncbi:hypothetical protein Dimus_007670 [Dionaea muscipula]